jgi:hypothetical protein
VVGVCVAALAPPASAGWLAPQPVSSVGQAVQYPAIALGADGRVFATWMRYDGTTYRVDATSRAPGGSFEPPQPVSEEGLGASSPRLAVDGRGNAILMWAAGALYQWAERPAGAAAFGEVHTVALPAGERASTFALRVSDAGEPAALILTQADEGTPPSTQPHQRVRTLTRAPSGALQAGPVLDEGTNDSTNNYTFNTIDLDVDAAGTFYATWLKRLDHMSSPSGSTSAVRVAVRPPGAGAAFAAPEDVDTATANSGDAAPDVILGQAAAGADAGGTFRVAYIRRIETPMPAMAEVLLRSRPPGGGSEPGSSFSAGTETVAALQPDGPVNLAFDVGAGGGSVLAWARGPSTLNRTVEACIRPPAGPCGPKQPLASGAVIAPVAAMGAGGDAVAAWRRFTATGNAGEASFARGGTFGALHELGTGSAVAVSPEATAVDPMGDAVLATERSTGPDRVIEAFVNDSAAPSIANVSIPSGEPGDPLAFGATVTDVWSPFTAIWDFGDGPSALGPGATHAYARTGSFNAVLTAADSEGNAATQGGTVGVRRIPPRILSFGMTHRRFAVGARATPLSGARRRVPVGTIFRFKLSEAATARIAIQRKRGRKWKKIGTLKRRAPAGPKRVKFSGRLRRKPLAAGRYRAVLVATDSAKNRSKPRRLGFTVVRR